MPSPVTASGRSLYRTNGSESHLFGLEPNYGCCTANMHQGWPKLALHAVQQTDRGVVIAHLLPVSAEAEIDGKPVAIRVESDYPFRMGAQITVTAREPVAFELKLRLPAWAKAVRLNDRPVHVRQGHFRLERLWEGREVLRLEIEAAPHFVRRPTGLKTVEYGPLVFSLPIRTEYRMREYTRNGVERKFPYCDYELIPYGCAKLRMTEMPKLRKNRQR